MATLSATMTGGHDGFFKRITAHFKKHSHSLSLRKEKDCAFCSCLEKTIVAKGRVIPTEDPRAIFHAPCTTCSKAESAPINACAFCRHMRLYHLLYCEDTSWKYVIKLGTWQQIRERRNKTGCSLCDAIDNVIDNSAHVLLPPNVDKNDVRVTFNLKDIKTWDRNMKGSPMKEDALLCINVPDGTNGRRLFHPSGLSIFHPMQENRQDTPAGCIAQRVAWNRVRATLQRCVSMHDACRLDEQISTEQPDHMPSLLPSLPPLPPSFHLIDVKQRCLVPIGNNNSRFVALSYVWGPKTNVSRIFTTGANLKALEIPGSLRAADLPAVIEGAIQACTNLNESFLWVDRLCIVQDDDEIKEANINAMASIYTHAVLVLVMASGDGIDTPIPGIQQPRPWPVGQTRKSAFGPLTLMTRLPTMNHLMTRCAWETRGWTYQEAVLARRRLFLTPLQAVFVCKEGIVYEDNGLNDEPWHQVDISRAHQNRYNNLPSVRGTDSISLFSLYREHVKSYSQRTLTLPTDVYRAIAGVLVALYGSPESVWYGLPLHDFDSALLWEIDWRPRVEPIKRCCSGTSVITPSWSWSHIQGPVRYDAEWCGSLVSWARVLDDSGQLLPLVECAEPTTKMPEAWQVLMAVAAAEGCLEKSGSDLGAPPSFWKGDNDHGDDLDRDIFRHFSFPHSDYSATEDLPQHLNAEQKMRLRLQGRKLDRYDNTGFDDGQDTDYISELQEKWSRRWPTYRDYWDEVLGSLPPLQRDDLPVDTTQPLRPGMLAARVQIAHLRVKPTVKNRSLDLYDEKSYVGQIYTDTKLNGPTPNSYLDVAAIAVHLDTDYSYDSVRVNVLLLSHTDDGYSHRIGAGAIPLKIWTKVSRKTKIICLE